MMALIMVTSIFFFFRALTAESAKPDFFKIFQNLIRIFTKFYEILIENLNLKQSFFFQFCLSLFFGDFQQINANIL